MLRKFIFVRGEKKEEKGIRREGEREGKWRGKEEKGGEGKEGRRGEDDVYFWSETLTYFVPKELPQQKFLIHSCNGELSYEEHRLYLDNVCGGGNGE